MFVVMKSPGPVIEPDRGQRGDKGLVRLLASDPELVLVGATASPATALEAIRCKNVDVVLLDYDLGTHSADAFVTELRASGFTGKILLVTAGLPDREALRIIRAGVSGRSD